MPNALTIILLACLSFSVGADELTQLNPIYSGLESAGMSQDSLSNWALEPEEIERLNQLIPLEKPFSDVSNLTPYEILGKYAETNGERAEYAKRYVEAMVNHQKRSLEWGVAVAAIVNSNDYRARMLNGAIGEYLSSIGYSGKIEGTKGAKQKRNIGPKRIHAFVESINCAKCSTAFATAMKLVDEGEYTGVDVVFVGMKTEDQVAATQWALQHDIDADMVKGRKVTLNFENDDWAKERKNRSAPLLLNSATGQAIES